jgi:hypothetical protein
VLEVFAQLLFLLALLIFVGEPFRAVVLRRFDVFSDLDLVQKGILDVFVGGLILYALAILPFGLFSFPIVLGFTVLCIILSIVIQRKTLICWLNPSKFSVLFEEKKKSLSIYLIVFIIFLIFLSINLSSLSGLVFGSVRDESIHSLYTQVILQNHSIPWTLQPYLPEGIIYPQGAHAVFAYASYFLSLEIPQIVLYVSVLFKSLSIFGAYFLGRKLGKGVAYSLGLSFVFAFISSWPLNVTWGANPFLVGFPFFLVCLGLLYSLFRKHSFSEVLLVGLLFGYTGVIILSYLQTLILVSFLVFAYFLIQNRGKIKSTLGSFAVLVSVSLVPLSPFLYRFVALYQYPGHNSGLPSDFTTWSSQQVYFNQALQWAVDNLSPYLLLKVLIVFFMGSFAILLLVTKAYEDVNDNIISISRFALAIFAPAVFLSFVSFFLPGDFNVVSWGHEGMILSVPISILIIASYMKFVEYLQEGRFKPLARLFPKNSKVTLLVIIAVLSLVTAPFLYYRLIDDSTSLRGAYEIYSVTTQSDYDLMSWMKANFSSPNSLILVHPFGSGLFIPSISNNKIVYPYTGSSLSISYQTLVSSLENETLSIEAYELMRNLSVTYIFVSSDVVHSVPATPKWEPDLFLANPNFKIEKNFNNSYLFKINGYDPTVSFQDDFEYENWYRNGWANNFIGNGLGNVTLAAGSGSLSSRNLVITAQAEPTITEFKVEYANWVGREIYVNQDVDAELSFNLDATEGFKGADTLAFIISNLNQSQNVIIATPNNIFQNYSNAMTLSDYQGSFSVDLSKMWQHAYHAPLPQTLVLNIANYDFDGTQNIAFIDNITITQKPSTNP